MTRKQFATRFALLSAVLAPVAPAWALDMRFSPTPGNTPDSLKDDTLGINRADGKLFWKRPDGSPGVGALLNVLPSGRRAVEQGQADDQTVGGVSLSSVIKGEAGKNVITPDTLQILGGIIEGRPPGSAVAGSTQTTSNGGSQSYHGDVTDKAGARHFAGPDGTEQLRVTWYPAATAYVNVMGGITGVGATLSCQNDAAADAPCNIVAQGRGRVNIGNGSGIGLQILDLGSPAASPLLVTPGAGGAKAKISALEGVQIDAPTGKESTFTVGGLTAGRIRNPASVTTSSAWMEWVPSDGTLARQRCEGTAPTVNCYIGAKGTGTINLGNEQGSIAAYSNSAANTVYDYSIYRAASTTTPLLWQTGGGLSNLRIGGSGGVATALATNATVGFPGIPTMAGTPTGTPVQASAGTAYLVYDTTNSKLCVYVSAWKCSAAFQ